MRGERGQTSVEHLRLLVVLVALVIALVSVAGPVGGTIRSAFEHEICAVLGAGCSSSPGNPQSPADPGSEAPIGSNALRTAVKDLPLAVKDRLIAAGALRSPLSRLPKYAGGKTEGILDFGTEESRLISGYKGPSASLPKHPRLRQRLKSHVEGHAAATMRQTGATRATLYINQNPCRVCVARLPRALPEGYELRVVGPDGTVWIFRGLPGG